MLFKPLYTTFLTDREWSITLEFETRKKDEVGIINHVKKRKPYFKDNWKPLANNFISLHLSFFICKA